MTTPTTIAAGQFDDALQETSENQVSRSGNTYIDTYDPTNEKDDLDWPDTPDEDEDDLEEEYDDIRVEDEDWENAERGALDASFSLVYLH